MAQNVSIGVKADTGQAQKDLRQFGTVLGNLSKLWENAFGSRGQRQAGSGLQQLTRGLSELGRAADRANLRLKATNDALAQVTSRRKSLEDTTGSVLIRDKEIYKSLSDQEKALTRQQRTWTTIANIRGRMAQNAGLQPGANGQFIGPNGVAPGATGPGGGPQQPRGGPSPLSRFASPISMIANSMGGSAAGSLIGGMLAGGALTAIAGVAAKAIVEAVESQKETADFIPRMRPGALAGTDAFGLNRRMRGIGMPFGFNTRESTAIFEAMSEGGSNFGRGLERDSRTAMQFGRMFGIDAAGEASMLATAQRTGAFRAGDAKRFAGMLAQEIARTGLGPRAQEVQEATLMLLNRQVQTLGTANPGPIMALQTLFNKTGIPGLQGMNGANVINRIQDAVTNPSSEASEALNFSVFRKMGAKSLYDVRFLQEEGLNNRRYLPTLFRTIEQSAPNPEAADIALSEHTNRALSLHMLRALRSRFGGRLSNITSANLGDIQKMLGTGGGFLEKGAGQAMELPGNQLRKIEAHLHDLMMKFGEPAAQKLIAIADSADKTASRLQDIARSSDTVAHKTTAMADIMMRAAGIDPNSPGFHAAKRAAGVVGAGVGVVAGEVEKSRQFEATHPGQRRRLGQILMESTNNWLEHRFEQGFDRQYARERAQANTPRQGPKGSSVNPAPMLPDARVEGSFETYDTGGTAGASARGSKHLHITIEERGMVSDASRAALKRYIHDCVREANQDAVRSRPNTRNMRR